MTTLLPLRPTALKQLISLAGTGNRDALSSDSAGGPKGRIASLMFLVVAIVGCIATSTVSRSVPTAEEVLRDLVDPRTGDFRAEHRRYERRQPFEFSNGAIVETRWTLPSPRVADGPTSESTLVLPDGVLISKLFAYRKSETHLGLNGRTIVDPLLSSNRFKSELSGNGGTLPVELRVLLKRKNVWTPFVFRWDKDVGWTEAPGGARVSLWRAAGHRGKLEKFDYIIPSLGDCSTCHRGRRHDPGFGPIGVSLQRLDHDAISKIIAPGLHTNSIAENDDERLISEKRARDYLDTNCGYCHNPNGSAASSGLMLDHWETDPRRLGVCKPPIAFGSNALGEVYDIEPGYPEKSLALIRMKSLKIGVAMPELGRVFVDQAGVGVISAWIQAMTGECRLK